MFSVFKQKVTYYYLTASIIFIIFAGYIGVSDNPPGIFLLYMGTIFFILAFIHNIRSSKSYWTLFVFSLIGMVVLAPLHGVFEEFGKGTFIAWIGVSFFIIAVLICPSCILISIAGLLINAVRKLKHTDKQIKV